LKLIRVTVKPNARESAFEATADGGFLARVKALPIEGRANEELVALIARHFGLRRSQVRIQSGASGRLKRVQLDL
jgi:uncharacterized protein YggU (UPF0235/DUF167 family)